ncbi:hypothetical protein LSTR_LSTR011334 [Laodelphax striatellus]|uniref:Cytochrome b561 domain-containing protein n=1 Tax=Laodelphax striatellus TaxID=195883 RepID=A0A482WGK5_LAOST|nr:hypothetical protein LSTR_LSTR011334 [Laodelphax striatellus]
MPKGKLHSKHYQQSDDTDDDMSCGRWCDNAGRSDQSLLPSDLRQTVPHAIPRPGHTVHCDWLHSCLGLEDAFVVGFFSFLILLCCEVCGGILQLPDPERSTPISYLCCRPQEKRYQPFCAIFQFVVGFFSFLILLCCEGATAAFRAALVPIHASFGVTTFMLAVATCLTGLTQKAILQFGKDYASWPEESIIMNALAMVLVALGILVSYAVRRDSVGRRPGSSSSQDGGKFISERL